MEIYKFVDCENGDILLSKVHLDLNAFNICFQNGDILLKIKKNNIKITTIQELNNYNFQNSIILSCQINNNPLFCKLKYKSILLHIYKLIDNGTKIIKNSKLNIKTTKKEEHGFYFIESLGISVQGVNSNKCINEIINQVIENKIKITMFIKLNNESNEIIEINF